MTDCYTAVLDAATQPAKADALAAIAALEGLTVWILDPIEGGVGPVRIGHAWDGTGDGAIAVRIHDADTGDYITAAMLTDLAEWADAA